MAESDNKNVSGAAQPQPGQVVTPGGPPTPSPTAPNDQAVRTAPPAPTPQAQPASPALSQAETTSLPARGAFSQQEVASDAASVAADGDITWTASEFVAHEKSTGWYGGLALATLVIAGLVYLVTRDIISTIVVLVGALALGVLGGRKPKQLQYHLDGSGVTIGQKRYVYEMFRSFSVVPEGAFSSIVFMPLKRFAPLTTIYYAPEDEDKIIDVLTQRLPFEERKADAVDNLMRRIRF